MADPSAGVRPVFAQLYASSRVPSEVESIVRGFVEHDLLRNDFVKNLTEIALVMDVDVENACTSANDDGLHTSQDVLRRPAAQLKAHHVEEAWYVGQ